MVLAIVAKRPIPDIAKWVFIDAKVDTSVLYTDETKQQ